MLSLALPVVLAELGWMSMGIVDVMMVGRVSAEAIGAVGIGRIAFYAVTVFGMGLLLGLDTLVSHAYGEGRPGECRRWLVQGLYLALTIGIPITALLHMGSPLLERWGIDPGVLEEALPYLRALALERHSPAAVLGAASLPARNRPGCARVMIALISANGVNLIGNWILIFGNLGAPALGAEGAGWSSLISSCYMTLVAPSHGGPARSRGAQGPRRRRAAPGFHATGTTARSGVSRGRSADRRDRRVCRRDRLRRPTRSDLDCGSPDRADHRQRHVHGSSGDLIRRRGTRGTGAGPAGRPRRGSRRLDRASFLRRFHERARQSCCC